jgi:hypothetical protein
LYAQGRFEKVVENQTLHGNALADEMLSVPKAIIDRE